MTRDPVDPGSVTVEMAVQIRGWRVDDDYSWRAVAQAASELWGSGHGGNQLHGRHLCAAAAEVLGEDPHQEPWN
ncbi:MULTISPECIES: hypothetical protein [unclassified Streptomyces]|uniref:hypothetical protein n=1 Tax=unclassified Streptomyces TaxID=2593676 RepID=UPI0033AC9B3E